MKALIAVCILVLGSLVGCGNGPTAPRDTNTARITPAPTPHPAPTPGTPCHPYPKCLG